MHAAVPSNTFAIYGQGQDKELTELVPGILNQLGPESLANLRKLAESYQSSGPSPILESSRLHALMRAFPLSVQAGAGGQKEGKSGEADSDDDVPDLVENFDAAGEVRCFPPL